MATKDGIAELKVGGSYFGGWTALSVGRSIEQVAGTFSLDVTDRWAGQVSSRPIKRGEQCELLLDGERVIHGYVDDVEVDFSAQNRAMRITGRDRTGDLVDCSAIHKSGQWRGAKLDTIARDLLAPFGIGLKVETDVGDAFPSFNVQEGETVFECLERGARMRAVLLVSDTSGNLVITRAGSELLPVVLAEGVNILDGKASFSSKDRFSSYVVKGQAHATDDFSGRAAAGPSAAVTDAAISRYRPLIILAEEHGSGNTLAMRATWERNVRAGRGSRATIRVQGWRRPDGLLWQPNTLVSVKSPSLYLDAPMLVVGCGWRLDDSGVTTELTIARREAFELMAGIGVSKLKQKLNHKFEAEKHKKSVGEEYV